MGIALPNGVEDGVHQLVKVALSSMVALFGTYQIAANGAAQSIWALASIMGLAKALEIASEEMKDDNARLAMLRDELIYRLTTEIPEAQLTGHPTKRLPGTASFVFKYIEGESLLLLLDAEGICASTGSACSSKSLEPSHVLLAIGLPHEIAHGSLRLTLSHETTKEDIDYIVEKVKYVVQTLRNFSPICPKELKEH